MESTLSSLFRNGFSRESILALARSVGVVERLRDIHPADVIEALVVTSTAEEHRSIASVRREYGRISGRSVEESSFYDRFTPELALLARRLWVCAMGALPSRALQELRPLLAAIGIKDLWAADGSQVALPSWAAESWPSTDRERGGFKITALFSVLYQRIERVILTSARPHDRAVFRLPRWMHGTLLLVDRGYFDANLFADVAKRHGMFLSRMKSNARPRIVAIRAGVSPALLNTIWSPTIPFDETADIDVELRLKNGKRLVARVVGVMRDWDLPVNGTPFACWLVTNVPHDVCNAYQVATLYRLRWGVETLFHMLKHVARIDHVRSGSPAVIEAFLYTALLTMTLTHTICAELRRQFPEREISTYRVMVLVVTWLHDILRGLDDRERPDALRGFIDALRVEGTNPNRERPYKTRLFATDIQGFSCAIA